MSSVWSKDLVHYFSLPAEKYNNTSGRQTRTPVSTSLVTRHPPHALTGPGTEEPRRVWLVHTFHNPLWVLDTRVSPPVGPGTRTSVWNFLQGPPGPPSANQHNQSHPLRKARFLLHTPTTRLLWIEPSSDKPVTLPLRLHSDLSGGCHNFLVPKEKSNTVLGIQNHCYTEIPGPRDSSLHIIGEIRL